MMLEGIPLEYEPPLGIGKEGRFKFFRKSPQHCYGQVWGEFFFFSKIIYQGLLEGDEIREYIIEGIV